METEADRPLRNLSPRWFSGAWRTVRGGSALLQILRVSMRVAFWLLIILCALTLIALLFVAFVPADSFRLTFSNDDGGTEVPVQKAHVLIAMAAIGAYLGGFALILDNLSRMIVMLMRGDPFHPDNVRRLKRVGLILAAASAGAWVGQTLVARLARGSMDPPGLFDLVTPFFSVLIVFILAEVFREGARLRRESELTI